MFLGSWFSSAFSALLFGSLSHSSFNQLKEEKSSSTAPWSGLYKTVSPPSSPLILMDSLDSLGFSIPAQMLENTPKDCMPGSKEENVSLLRRRKSELRK